MKAIERMAEAAWDKAANGLSTWDGLSQYGRELHISAMRSALIALADVELSEEAIDAAMMSVGYAEVDRMPIDDVRKAPIYFRAILRHLIEEPMGDEASQHGDGLHDTNNREAE